MPARKKPEQLPFPEGFLYKADFISETEESELVANIQRLEFGQVVMHGVAARRRVAHFGWHYSFETFHITPGPPIPEFLVALREKCAPLIEAAAPDLAEALVTEYTPGAVIGWHRDAPPFGSVVAVSLLGNCRLRLRRGEGEPRERRAAEIAPRSVYVLTGPVRTAWQHSIPPVESLRYSITFRTLRKKREHA